MKTLDVKTDPYLWAEIPLEYPFGPFQTQEDWAEAVGEAYSAQSEDADDVRERLVDIALALPCTSRPGLVKLLWLAPDPDKQPLLLNVNAVLDTGAELTVLQELAGAYETDPVRPPVVDQLESALFGTIARVLSYVKDEERNRLVMQVCLVGWADGVLVRLDAFTSDLPYGVLAVDPITELMNAITIVDATEKAGEARSTV